MYARTIFIERDNRFLNVKYNSRYIAHFQKKKTKLFLKHKSLKIKYLNLVFYFQKISIVTFYVDITYEFKYSENIFSYIFEC